jgi:hypothetical protein
MAKLTDIALEISLEISTHTFRKKDVERTGKLCADHGADADAATINRKTLWNESLVARAKNVRAARQYVEDHAMRWSKSTYIIQQSDYTEISGAIRDFQLEDQRLLLQFFGEYESSIEASRLKAGSFFNFEDYPGLDYLRGRFAFEFVCEPLKDTDDVRAKLGGKLTEREVRNIEASAKKAEVARIKAGTGQLLEKVAKAVANVAAMGGSTAVDSDGNPVDSTTYKPAHTRDTLASNLADLAAVLPNLNFSDNTEIDKLSKEIGDLGESINVEELRKDPKMRSEKAAEAAKVAETVEKVAASLF